MLTESYYHVPEWMQNILNEAVEAGLAQRLTNAIPNERKIFSFEVQVDNTSWTECSREKETIIWKADFQEIYDFVVPRIGSDSTKIFRLVEEYSQNRRDREALQIHQGLVQLIISHGVSISMHVDPNRTVILRGNFDLIGRLPDGANVQIHGNVETIEGSVGSLLQIFGNVNQLGCGPFWAESPLKGGCKLEIHGDVKGYKSSIDNEDMEIEIFGSIKTSSLFIRRGKFSKMTIHGSVNCNSPFPGLFAGTIIVVGDIKDMDWQTPERWRNTSASKYGDGNIFHCERQLVKNGRLVTT